MIEIPTPWVSAALVGTVGLLTGWLIGRVDRRRLESRLEAEIARRSAQARDQSRTLVKAQSDQGLVASLALTLPAVVRELNRADCNDRQVPPLILTLAEAIFHPKQILFYKLCAGERAGSEELRLIEHSGLREIPPSLQRVPLGKGKIGWAAARQLDMLKDDWVNLACAEGMHVEDNHPSLQFDIVGPLLRQDGNGAQTLGMICLGALGTRPRNEKLMFQLVTSLGSLAMVNVGNVRRLRTQADTDGLTRLYTKRHFMTMLAEVILAAATEAHSLAIFIFDVDHFKNYNDTHGHPAGDELLKALAALLREQARPGDLVARYGGEEFIIAMPKTNREQALAAAERIRSQIEQFSFALQQTQPGGTVTISGGVAVFPEDGTSGAELIRYADEALYESKRNGRNRVTRYRGIDIGHGAPEPEFEPTEP